MHDRLLSGQVHRERATLFALMIAALTAAASSHQASAWDLPEQELFFLSAPKDTWIDLPPTQREHIKLSPPAFRRLYGATQDQDTALRQIRECIHEKWLPNPELIKVFTHATAAAGQKFFCNYYRDQCFGVAYAGVIGSGFLLYIEQPDPLPEGQKKLTAEDVLKDGLLQTRTNDDGETTYPPAQFMVRNFHRYRALKPEGPYQPVNILLAQVRFPDEVNLRCPGYR